jgi:hypothetical protein
MRALGWVIEVALLCCAISATFSIFSELKFLVDGWTWSVDQVPISDESFALAIGKLVSGIVGGYRESVQSLVQVLLLPKLPQAAYDVAITTVAVVAVRITSIVKAEQAIDGPLPPRRGIAQIFGSIVAQSLAVILSLLALFGTDYLYRHFA